MGKYFLNHYRIFSAIAPCIALPPTSEQEGHTGFVHGSLGDILLGKARLPERDGGKIIFSPFGLGVLDLAVADLVLKTTFETGGGTLVNSFLP